VPSCSGGKGRRGGRRGGEVSREKEYEEDGRKRKSHGVANVLWGYWGKKGGREKERRLVVREGKTTRTSGLSFRGSVVKVLEKNGVNGKRGKYLIGRRPISL